MQNIQIQALLAQSSPGIILVYAWGGSLYSHWIDIICIAIYWDNWEPCMIILASMEGISEIKKKSNLKMTSMRNTDPDPNTNMGDLYYQQVK